jgi:anaphase-promoting complex subunit 5
LAWCAGNVQAGYEAVEKDPLTNGLWEIQPHLQVCLIFVIDSIIFKTHADMKSWAQPEPYAAWAIIFIILATLRILISYLTYSSWEKGQATGDETTASENLRRFFEQHFHESNDSYVVVY